jgi:glycerol kinase
MESQVIVPAIQLVVGIKEIILRPKSAGMIIGLSFGINLKSLIRGELENLVFKLIRKGN